MLIICIFCFLYFIIYPHGYKEEDQNLYKYNKEPKYEDDLNNKEFQEIKDNENMKDEDDLFKEVNNLDENKIKYEDVNEDKDDNEIIKIGIFTKNGSFVQDFISKNNISNDFKVKIFSTNDYKKNENEFLDKNYYDGEEQGFLEREVYKNEIDIIISTEFGESIGGLVYIRIPIIYYIQENLLSSKLKNDLNYLNEIKVYIDEDDIIITDYQENVFILNSLGYNRVLLLNHLKIIKNDGKNKEIKKSENNNKLPNLLKILSEDNELKTELFSNKNVNFDKVFNLIQKEFDLLKNKNKNFICWTYNDLFSYLNLNLIKKCSNTRTLQKKNITTLLVNYYYHRNGFPSYSKKYNEIKNPFLSVVIPIDNDEIFMYTTLSSLKEENNKNLEIIFINRSNKKYISKTINDYIFYDKRIKLIENKSNKNIELKGKYTIFMKSGDILYNNIIDKLYEFINKNENYDFIQINKLIIQNDLFYEGNKLYKHEKNILYQKNSFYKLIMEDKKIYNYNDLYGKVFSSDLVNKAFKELNTYNNNSLYYFNDEIINLILLKLIKTYINSNIDGYIVGDRQLTNLYFSKEAEKQRVYDFIKYCEYFINIFNNSFEGTELIPIQYKNYIYFLLHEELLTDKKLIGNVLMLYKQRIISENSLFDYYFDIALKKIQNIQEDNENGNELKGDENLFKIKELSNEEIQNKRDVITYYLQACTSGILYDIEKHEINPNPKLSIIIPIYNAQEHIIKLLRTIQNQFFKDLEIIMLDDCSQDDSIEIIKRYQEEDKRIKLIKNTVNRRTLGNRIFGVKEAKGEYIFFIDQDDFFLPNIFEKTYKYLKENNADIGEFECFWYSDGVNLPIKEVRDTPGHLLNRNEMDNLFYVWNIWKHAYKREVAIKAIESIGLDYFNYKVHGFEDYIQHNLFFHFANSYLYIREYGYSHNNYIKIPKAVKSMPDSQKKIDDTEIASAKYIKHSLKIMKSKFDYYLIFRFIKEIYPFLIKNKANEYKDIFTQILNSPFASEKDKSFINKNLNK